MTERKERRVANWDEPECTDSRPEHLGGLYGCELVKDHEGPHGAFVEDPNRDEMQWPNDVAQSATTIPEEQPANAESSRLLGPTDRPAREEE